MPQLITWDTRHTLLLRALASMQGPRRDARSLAFCMPPTTHVHGPPPMAIGDDDD